jgi:hypothetical protein
VKSKATRAACGTKGTKQEKAIKSIVSGAVVTPATSVAGIVAAPVSSSPSPAPASVTKIAS